LTEKQRHRKIVYFDKETVGNMLQQLHGGTVANVSSRLTGSETKAEVDTEADAQVDLHMPLVARFKFAITGKLSATYVKKSSSLTTVTATDVGQFDEIKGGLEHFENESLKEIPNSLTSFRMAAGYLNAIREGVDGLKTKELVDVLDSSEGYGLYDIGEGKYVRFNSKAFVSNYKYNDILLSKLDLYCIPIGLFDPSEFDYMRRMEDIGYLFQGANSVQKRPLDELFSNAISENGTGSGDVETLNTSQTKLYDVVCAYISGGAGL